MKYFKKALTQNTSTNVVIDKLDTREKYYPFYIKQNCSSPDNFIYKDIEFFSSQQCTLKNCFLTNSFVTKILDFHENNITLDSCIIEVDNFNTLHHLNSTCPNISNSTIYIASSSSNIPREVMGKIFSLLIKSNNELNMESYLMYLIRKDLLSETENLNGLLLRGCNLNNENIPKNKNLFLNCGDTSIYDGRFSNINFDEYDLDETKFENCSFSKNCILSKTILKNKVTNCYLPIINFNLFESKDYKSMSFTNCILHEDTIFPDYIDFFTKASFVGCYIPKTDFSKYNLKEDSLKDCILDDNCNLPNSKEFKLTEFLLNLKSIPNNYIDHYAIYAPIPNPLEFYKKNQQLLKDYSFFIFNKKYLQSKK